MTETRRDERDGTASPRGPFKIGYLAYQQVAALIATFALIAFLSHFFDFEWRGFVATLVAQWNEYVRPAVKWLLHLLVETPLAWFGWQVEIPLLWRDYLGVGMITALSVAREDRRSGGGVKELLALPWDDREMLIGNLINTLLWPPVVVVAWPLTTGLLILVFVESVVDRDKDVVSYVLILSPLLYLGLLVAVNYWVL